jgi:hypothetical protein
MTPLNLTGNRMFRLIPLLFLLLLNNCAVDNQSYIQNMLVLEIAEQHFNDFAISDMLKPVRGYEEWSRGRTELVTGVSGKVVELRLSSPNDTVFYSKQLLSTLVSDGLITENDKAYFEASISQSVHDLKLLNESNLKLTIFDIQKHIVERKKTNSGLIPYYRFSRPVTNRAKDLVILMVDEFSGPMSNGHLYLFKRVKDKWEIVYWKEVWIT